MYLYGPVFYQLAHLAVMAFFVLSGYIIMHVSLDTENSSEYFKDRVTRIYFVLVPAVILTAVLDYIGSSAAPDFYKDLIPHDRYFIRFADEHLGYAGGGKDTEYSSERMGLYGLSGMRCFITWHSD